MTTATENWITGEEFAAERRRLFDAGYKPSSPEYTALTRRVDERDTYLFETYGQPLMASHPGKWVAISLDGEVVLADRELEAMQEGQTRFGPGNFCVSRLQAD